MFYCWAVMTQSQGRFSFSWCPASNELGGASSRTAAPEWPGGYPTPCDTKVGRVGFWGGINATCEHQRVVTSCIVHHLFIYSFIIIIITFPSFPIQLNCVSQPTSFTFSPVLPTYPSVGGWASSCVVLHCCWVTSQQSLYYLHCLAFYS